MKRHIALRGLGRQPLAETTTRGPVRPASRRAPGSRGTASGPRQRAGTRLPPRECGRWRGPSQGRCLTATKPSTSPSAGCSSRGTGGHARSAACKDHEQSVGVRWGAAVVVMGAGGMENRPIFGQGQYSSRRKVTEPVQHAGSPRRWEPHQLKDHLARHPGRRNRRNASVLACKVLNRRHECTSQRDWPDAQGTHSACKLPLLQTTAMKGVPAEKPLHRGILCVIVKADAAGRRGSGVCLGARSVGAHVLRIIAAWID